MTTLWSIEASFEDKKVEIGEKSNICVRKMCSREILLCFSGLPLFNNSKVFQFEFHVNFTLKQNQATNFTLTA